MEQGREHGGHVKSDEATIAGAHHVDASMHSEVAQHGRQAVGLEGRRVAGDAGGGGLPEEDEVGDEDGELRLQKRL